MIAPKVVRYFKMKISFQYMIMRNNFTITEDQLIQISVVDERICEKQHL